MRGGVRNHTASVKLLQVVHLTIPRRNSRKLGWNAYPTGPRGCWWWSRHPSCLVVFSLKPSDPSDNPRTHWLESFHPLRTPNQKQPKSPMTITFQNLPMQSYWTWRPTRCSPAYKTAIHHKLYPIPASQIPSPYWHQLVQKDSLFHPAISRWIKNTFHGETPPLLTISSPCWLLGRWRPPTSPQETERHHLKRHTSVYDEK